MMRSVSILFSFFVTLSQGDEFSLEQMLGAVIIMLTIVVHAQENAITDKYPKLDLICPSCRIDQICYKRVSTIDIEANEEQTKEWYVRLFIYI